MRHVLKKVIGMDVLSSSERQRAIEMRVIESRR